ncbi:hypothetical protein L1887_38976 [Cichorium endivia]|nr:hypothetical protein L1887_38976 [Cichorium endivia]
MLQGNAIEDHFISVSLEHQKPPERFRGRLIRAKTFRLHLPNDWYNDFCGFLICIVSKTMHLPINIIIRQEVDEDSRSELCQESNEAVDPEYDETETFLGYVSFSSMTHTTFWNSSYNSISFSLEAESYVGAELIPRKNKGDQVQRTKVAAVCSEFWDKKYKDGTTFTIQHDSIKILWQHDYDFVKEIVMQVDVHNDREQRMALKIVSMISGVHSISRDTKDSTLTVIGDVDPVLVLVKLLKYWHAELKSVGPAKGQWELRGPTIFS